jgi:hypothetical protein
VKYVGWGRSLLVNRNVRTDDLVDRLLIMQEVIAEHLGKDVAGQANEHIQLALDTFDSFADAPPSCIDPSSSLSIHTSRHCYRLIEKEPDGFYRLHNRAVSAWRPSTSMCFNPSSER